MKIQYIYFNFQQWHSSYSPPQRKTKMFKHFFEESKMSCFQQTLLQGKTCQNCSSHHSSCEQKPLTPHECLINISPVLADIERWVSAYPRDSREAGVEDQQDKGLISRPQKLVHIDPFLGGGARVYVWACVCVVRACTCMLGMRMVRGKWKLWFLTNTELTPFSAGLGETMSLGIEALLRQSTGLGLRQSRERPLGMAKLDTESFGNWKRLKGDFPLGLISILKELGDPESSWIKPQINTLFDKSVVYWVCVGARVAMLSGNDGDQLCALKQVSFSKEVVKA